MPRPRKTVDVQGFIAAAERRIREINDERNEIMGSLRRLLANLGEATPARGRSSARRAAAPATPTRRNKGGRRPGFRMSAEAKARISAAQKKRWAAYRAKKNK